VFFVFIETNSLDMYDIKTLTEEEIKEVILLKKCDDMVERFLLVLPYVMKDGSKYSLDKNILTITKLGETITLRVSFGKKYVLLTNGTRKIQIVYGSKTNTESSLADRIIKLIEPIIKKKQEDWLTFSSKVKCDHVADTISDKLKSPVSKSKVKGVDKYYYRIKTKEFESLHISSNAKSITNVRFNDKLTSFKDMTSKNIFEKYEVAKDELDNRFNKMHDILKKLEK